MVVQSTRASALPLPGSGRKGGNRETRSARSHPHPLCSSAFSLSAVRSLYPAYAVPCAFHIAASVCTRPGCCCQIVLFAAILLKSYNSQGPFLPVAISFQSPARIARLSL